MLKHFILEDHGLMLDVTIVNLCTARALNASIDVALSPRHPAKAPTLLENILEHEKSS